MDDEDQKINLRSRARDHMANERTFLAWIRTSIGIMAFGFVVEKFGFFINSITGFLHTPEPQTNSSTEYSSIFGISLVVLGVLICVLAFIKYKKVENEIENDTYRASALIDVMLTLSVLLIGIFLAIYLNTNM